MTPHQGHDLWQLRSKPGRTWCRTCQVEFTPIPEEEGPPQSEPWTVTEYLSNNATYPPRQTVFRFAVEDPYGEPHIIGVDHHLALPILQAIHAGDVVLIQPPEPWQILG